VRHTLSDADVAALAASAHAFVAADLAALVSEAAMTALRRMVAARQCADSETHNLKPAPVATSQPALPAAESPPRTPQPTAQQGEVSPGRGGGGNAGDGVAEAAASLGGLSLTEAPAAQPAGAAPASGTKQLSASGCVTGAAGDTALAAAPSDPAAARTPLLRGSDGVAAAVADLAVTLAATPADFAAARGRVRPSGLREVALELPDTRWSDVGGLADVKQQLQVCPPEIGRIHTRRPLETAACWNV